MIASPRRAFLTRHARQRCIEMGLTRADVVVVLLDPETTYPSPPHYGPGRRVSTRGYLAVVHTDDFSVITVLWNRQCSRGEGPYCAA